MKWPWARPIGEVSNGANFYFNLLVLKVWDIWSLSSTFTSPREKAESWRSAFWLPGNVQPQFNPWCELSLQLLVITPRYVLHFSVFHDSVSPLRPPAIRFGRMPRSEKAKLKAEILTCEHDLEDSETADLKSLAKRIYEAYLKNFNMNKVKARVILAGKTNNNPVGGSALLVTVWRLPGPPVSTS